MTTFYPEFQQNYKSFNRDMATLNGYFAVRDYLVTSKPADGDIKIRFELSGTAVEGLDYDILADSANWTTAPADTSHIFSIPEGNQGGALWIRVNDPTKVTKPVSIVVELVEVLQGNALLTDGDKGQRLKAVAYIKPSSLWVPPDEVNHIGNRDGTGQGPVLVGTDVPLFPNWSQADVQVNWDIPVTAVRSSAQTEQRLSTYSYERTVLNPGDFEEEYVMHNGELDMEMSVVYTTTRDKNFDAYFMLLAAQRAGFCWVPFYPQPLYPLTKNFDPTTPANDRVFVFEDFHRSARRPLILGKRLIRVNAQDTTQFEVVKVRNELTEILDANTRGVMFVSPAMAEDIPDRASREICFTMLPMVMTSPLRRPSATDDVHHMPVTWQLIDS